MIFISTGDFKCKHIIKSVLTHWNSFRVESYSVVSDEVKEAWSMYAMHLLPKVSSKWSEEMLDMKRRGGCGGKQFSCVTISDETFVVHVLSLYLHRWDDEHVTSHGGKKKVGRKKIEGDGSPDEKKKISNYATMYRTVEMARAHENKTEWEEAILYELLHSDESSCADDDIAHQPSGNGCALPMEEIDMADWEEV